MAKLKRRKKGLSSKGLSSRRRTTRKVGIKRRKKRKGMLSEFFSDNSAGKAMISGGLGGAASLLVDFAASAQTAQVRGLVKIAAGYGIAKFLKYDNVGAGMAGAGVVQLLAPAFGLSEGDANYADPIKALPRFLNENNAMLSESQTNAMLSDQRTQEPDSYMPWYAPSFANANY